MLTRSFYWNLAVSEKGVSANGSCIKKFQIQGKLPSRHSRPQFVRGGERGQVYCGEIARRDLVHLCSSLEKQPKCQTFFLLWVPAFRKQARLVITNGWEAFQVCLTFQRSSVARVERLGFHAIFKKRKGRATSLLTIPPGWSQK